MEIKKNVNRAEENIKHVVDELEKIPVSAPRGFSVSSVREDRDNDY